MGPSVEAGQLDQVDAYAADGRQYADVAMRPGQPMHELLRKRLRALRERAVNHYQQRHAALDEMEQLYLNYVDPHAVGEDGQPLQPHERSIVVPVTYAAVRTLHTHIYGAFTASHPWLRLYSPQVRVADATEGVLEAGHVQDRTRVKLWAWILDALKYGQGRITTAWESQYEEVEQDPMAMVMGLLGAGGAGMMGPTWRLRKEGQVTYNIPPREYFADPAVPGWDPQAGDYVMVRSRRSRTYLWQMQQQGRYFNITHLGPASGGSPGTSNAGDQVPGQVALAEAWMPTDAGDDLGYYQLDTLYVRLVPRLWRAEDGSTLGPESNAQIWAFGLASRAGSREADVVVRAERLENAHGQFPVAVMNWELDVHTLFPQSAIEVVQGLQQHIDFTYNYAMASARMALYGAIFWDPRFLEEADMFASQPGLRVRIKPEMDALRDPRRAAFQMQFGDPSGALLQRVPMLADFLKQTLGAGDVIQGIMPDPNQTATAVHGTIQNALSRVAVQAALMWDHGIVPFAEMEISDAQQYMSEPRWVLLSGEAASRWGAERGWAEVGPQDLQGRVYVTPIDLLAPGDRQAQGRMFAEAAMAVGKDPVLSAKYDASEMFEEALRLSGIRNMHDFLRPQRVRTQVMPDEQVLAQVQAGNLAPQPAEQDPLAALMAGAGGAGNGRPA